MNKHTSLGEVYISQLSPQERLIEADGFARHLSQRGIPAGVETLESWEQLGLLLPIIRLRKAKNETAAENEYWYWPYSTEPSFLHEYGNLGWLEYPQGDPFRPWSEYLDEHGEKAVVNLYHPIQTLTAWKLYSRLTVCFPRSTLIDDSEFDPWKARLESEQKIVMEALLSPNEHDLRVQRLLLVMGDKHLPRIRHGYLYSGSDKDPGREYKAWLDWSQSLNVRSMVSSLDLDISAVMEEYKSISRTATDIDPLRHWYVLVRHIRRDKLRSLVGKALLAQDLYDLALTLKHTLTDLVEEHVLDPDEITDGREGTWKERRYHGKVDYYDTRILANVLSEYGLNPTSIANLLFEGDTEVVAIPMIAQAMRIDLKKRRIRFESMNGSSIDLSKWTKILMRIRDENGIAFIIVDKENDSELRLEDLTRLRLVEKDNCVTWKNEFEGDNWTEEEMAAALTECAEGRGIKYEFTADQVRDCHRSGVKISECPIRIAWQLAKLRISKPEYGRKLAQITCRRIEYQRMNGNYSPTSPIEKVLARIAGEVSIRWTRTYPVPEERGDTR